METEQQYVDELSIKLIFLHRKAVLYIIDKASRFLSVTFLKLMVPLIGKELKVHGFH